MPALDSKLRSQLDDVCQKAREKAEEAARSALQKRAVDAAEPHAHFTPAEKELRNRLRARGRQAGDVRQANKTQGIEQLIQELAYEYWHRMLFARLLAENHLLMHPDGVAVSLEECEELAREVSLSRLTFLFGRQAGKPDLQRLCPCSPVCQQDAATSLPYRRRAAGGRICPGASLGPGKVARQPAKRDLLG